MRLGETPISPDITGLLKRIQGGDAAAESALILIIYKQLHAMAQNQMRHERRDHTLQATVLVDEAFLHLLGETKIDWQNRAQFFALASRVMRRVLVDHARAAKAEKRPKAHQQVELNSAIGQVENKTTDIIAVDIALSRLAQFDLRQSQIVEMRFFAGLNFKEIATVLGISERTAQRDWTMARAWLHSQMVLSEHRAEV